MYMLQENGNVRKITEDFLYPFLGSQVAMVEAICRRIEDFGITIPEALDMVMEHNEALLRRLKIEKKLQTTKTRDEIICPVCGSPLKAVPVNTSRGDQVGGDYNLMLSCANMDSCIYTKLLKR